MGRYRSLLIAAAIFCGAFAVQAAGSLPSGYTEVEYIQGDGASARLITDYTPNPQTDKIEAVIEWPAETIGGNQQVWCARGTSGTDKTYTLFAIGSNLRFDYNKTRGDLLTPEISEGVKYTVTADRYMFTWSGGNGQTTPSRSGARMSSFTISCRAETRTAWRRWLTSATIPRR